MFWKIFDEHPRHFHSGVPPPRLIVLLEIKIGNIVFFKHDLYGYFVFKINFDGCPTMFVYAYRKVSVHSKTKPNGQNIKINSTTTTASELHYMTPMAIQ